MNNRARENTGAGEIIQKTGETDHVAADITYLRRTNDGLLTTSNIAELFPDWRGAAECWMFVSPHDDDVAIGAGLTFQAGLAEGAAVHAVVVTDGRMGYCDFKQRRDIVKVRRAEAEKSYGILGLPADRLRFIECPDCNLSAFRGRHFTTIGAPTEIEGAGGMQNAFTTLSGKSGRIASSYRPAPTCTPIIRSSTRRS